MHTLDSRTTASTTTTEREVADAVDSLIDVAEDDYSYEDEDEEEYYEESYNEVEDTFTADTGVRSPKSHDGDDAVNIYKYEVDSQEQTRGDNGDGNLTLLVSLDHQQNVNLMEAEEGDQGSPVKSADYPAVTGETDASDLIFSKAETSEPKSYSSLKLDTASMSTKTAGGDNDPVVPMTASQTKSMSAAATVPVSFSFVSFILPILGCFKYFL